MENGTYLYALEMHTPLGTRRGYLELIVWENFLNGYLTMFTRTFPIQNGKRSGNHISFNGEMKTMMKSLSYQAEGKITGNKISLVLATNNGHYNATGLLAEEKRSAPNIKEKGGCTADE